MLSVLTTKKQTKEQKDRRKLLEVMEMFITWIVVRVTQLYMYTFIVS